MKKIYKDKSQLIKIRHRKELKRRARKYRGPNSFFYLPKDIEKVKNQLLTGNLKYISRCDKTPLFTSTKKTSKGILTEKIIKVPKILSLVEEPKDTYEFIEDVINTLYENKVQNLKIDYCDCKTIHLGAQVYLDVLYKYVFKSINNFVTKHPNHRVLRSVEPINYKNENVSKMLYSIGSFAVHLNQVKSYDDIISYPLCDFKISPTASELHNIEKKEVHVTEMVTYVIDSLARMGKSLTAESIESLSIIIGEVLINAEEHSTDKHRFSIGYFQEYKKDDEQFGIFNLAILNFGQTIYDTFKNEDCKRPEIVNRMQELSDKYKSKMFFNSNLKEETLWTLYALQEEITSVSPKKNEKRGNGSIKFIENFFNIKGEGSNDDKVSRLAILSGNTSIVFDGKYGVKEKIKKTEKFKVMTFNDSGEISDKPDSKYVKFVENYFPGTIISAQILINKDDVI